MRSEKECPHCKSKCVKKNGFTSYEKQNNQCLDCKKQFSSEIENNKDQWKVNAK